MNAAPAPLAQAEFASLLEPLGPWPKQRRIAVAVSGGADSMCLAWLAHLWGQPLALIVDHGLRPGSSDEALLTAERLAAFGVASDIVRLTGLAHGPGLAARARIARYAALTRAARLAGLCDLLLGHHAGDQAETVLIRSTAGSNAPGLAAMAAIVETNGLRLVRPLLAIPPARLRATLRAQDIGWVEDPSNQNPLSQRTRVRHSLACGEAEPAFVLEQAERAGSARSAHDAALADWLAARARIFPAGYAYITPGPIDPAGLAALIRALTGAPYAPATAALARLAATGHGTLGGVRMRLAGRLGPGTVLLREAAAMQRPIPATQSCLWDRRFQLDLGTDAPDDLAALNTLTLGALGEDAARIGAKSGLPYDIGRTLPALRGPDCIRAVPHAGYFYGWTNPNLRLRFSPTTPLAGAPFRVFGSGDA